MSPKNSSRKVREVSTQKPHRLGNGELGPYAFERSMPEWQKKRIINQKGIAKTVQYGSEPAITILILSNETPKLITTLSVLSKVDDNVKSFSYCHPATNHVGNRNRERGFCGYRSIAMMLSYLHGCSTAPKRPEYVSQLPNIIELQDMVENAWSQGINGHSKLETGGIRGTRKFIGTSEVEACFRYLGLPCSVVAVRGRGAMLPSDVLLAEVEKYFDSPTKSAAGKAPIFLQRQGHSMVIVGYEKRKNTLSHTPNVSIKSPYLANLVVFDCAQSVDKALLSLRDRPGDDLKRHVRLLNKYRVDRNELNKPRWGSRFELVFLDDEIASD